MCDEPIRSRVVLPIAVVIGFIADQIRQRINDRTAG
jgi:hypothetical protein